MGAGYRCCGSSPGWVLGLRLRPFQRVVHFVTAEPSLKRRLLELGLQVVVTIPKWILGIEFGSSAIAMWLLNTDSSLQPALPPFFSTVTDKQIIFK